MENAFCAVSFHFRGFFDQLSIQWQTLFSWAPKSLLMVTAAMKLKDVCSLEGKPWQT